MKISERKTFLDIHTHQAKSQNNVLALRSFFVQEAPEQENLFFSTGIHPWQVQKDSEKLSQKFHRVLQAGKLSAIGEIGLDRRKNQENLRLQKELFIEQMKAADEKNMPVIIHCVKACADLLKILKSENPKVPLIMHGFNENLHTAHQLLKYNVYFSFGEMLFKTHSKARKTALEIPHDRLFFETDDSKLLITEVYKHFSDISGKTVTDLRQQIASNFFEAFSRVPSALNFYEIA